MSSISDSVGKGVAASSKFIHSFLRSDIVTMIFHERLEQF